MDDFRLGDAILVKHGYAFPGSDFSDDPAYPTLVTPGNFAIGGGFKLGKPKTFVGEVPQGYSLPPGALVITMTDLSKQGDTLGLPARIPDDGTRYLHNQRIGLVQVTDPDRIDCNFLSYFLRTPAYRAHILGTASGSTVKHTSPGRIEAFVTAVPPVEDQRAIAEVLGALDDKIAANDRVVQGALDLAHATFQQTVRGISAGDQTFADMASIGGGGTPKTAVEEYWGGDVAWATPTDVTGLSAPYLRTTNRTITDAGLAACSSSLYPKGSILMTSRATIGAFAIAQGPTAVNQGFIVVNAKEPEHQWWLFHEMQDRVPEFLNYANGATFLELPRGKFKALEVRLPEASELARFTATVSRLHDLAAQVSAESEQLAATRDELLPLLMSGKVRVADIGAAAVV